MRQSVDVQAHLIEMCRTFWNGGDSYQGDTEHRAPGGRVFKSWEGNIREAQPLSEW
jgi:hypothetical protein